MRKVLFFIILCLGLSSIAGNGANAGGKDIAGDAEAAKYYEMLKDDPEFAMFLMDIETVKKTLKDRATIIITTDTEPYDILKKSPDIKPKKK